MHPGSAPGHHGLPSSRSSPISPRGFPLENGGPDYIPVGASAVSVSRSVAPGGPPPGGPPGAPPHHLLTVVSTSSGGSSLQGVSLQGGPPPDPRQDPRLDP